MEPLGIISGVLANALTALIAEAASDQAPGAARLPERLGPLLAAPAARLGRALSASGAAQDDRLAGFLVSDEVASLVRRLFSTHLAEVGEGSIDAIRRDFRALHAEIPGRAAATDEADTLFDALLDACNAALDAAIDRNLLAGHEAKAALRHRLLNDRLAVIEQNIALLGEGKPPDAATLDSFIADYLPRLRGADSPTRELLQSDNAGLQQALVEIQQHLRALTGARARSGTTPVTPQESCTRGPLEPPVPMPSGVLAVSLAPSADGSTRIHYRLKGRGPDSRAWGAPETEALRQAAGSDRAPSGERLFEHLFGTWPDDADLFRTLFPDTDATRPSPLAAPARLRIVTDDPALLQLPWGRLAWQGRRLIDYDWEIVTAAEPAPRRRCRTLPDAELLVVTDPGPAAGAHPPGPLGGAPRAKLRTLLQGLRRAKASPIRQVTGPEALAGALAGMRVHALFIELACAERQEGPVLLFGGDPPRPYPIAALEQALLHADPCPCLVVLALRGERAGALMAGLAGRLGRRVALVLRLMPGAADTATPDPARQALLGLLPLWLRDGDDPVAALHQLLRAAPRLDPMRPGAPAGPSCDPALIGIHANYGDWQTTPLGRSRDDPLPHLALDRDDQKLKVAGQVRKLARSSSDRVLLIVAYGSPENLVAQLCAQLQWHLELDVAGLAALAGQAIDLPEVPSPAGKEDLDATERLRAASEPHLRETLRATGDETLTQLLRRHAPRGLAPGEMPILWLDWGHIDLAAPGGAEHAEAALCALPRFCAETLGAACPAGIRLACILSIELSEDRYPSLTELFRQLQDEPWYHRDGFRFLPLEPLGQVDADHLHEYLREIDTALDARSRRDLVRLILAETSGNFDATVALLEEGRRRGWMVLLEGLEARWQQRRPRRRSRFLS